MAGDYAPSFYVASFEQQVPSALPAASAPLLTAVPHSAFGGQVYYSDGYAPPSAGYAPPPAGYAPPSAGYAPPSAGYAQPSAGYAPSSAGYAPPSAGYAQPSAGYAPSSAGYAPPSAGYAPAPAGHAPPPQLLSPNQYPAPVSHGQYAVPIRQAQPQQIAAPVYSEYIPVGGLLVYHQQQPRQYAPPTGANIYQQQGAIYNVPQQQQGQGLHYSTQASNPSVYPSLQQHQQPPAQIYNAAQHQPLQQPGYQQQQPQQYYSAPQHGYPTPPSAMDSQQQLSPPAYQNQAERSASVRRSRSGDRIAAAPAGRDNSNNVWAGARAQQAPPVVYPVPPQNQASPASGPGHRQLQQPAHKSPRPGAKASRSGRAISQQPRAPTQGSISGGKAAPAISAYCDMQTNETYAFDAPPLAYRNQRANAPPIAYGSESKESNKSDRSAKSNKSLKSLKSKKSMKGPSHGNADLTLSPSVSKDSLNRVTASLKANKINPAPSVPPAAPLRQQQPKPSVYSSSELRTPRLN